MKKDSLEELLERYEWLRYRWEFLRRDREYRKTFRKASRGRHKHKEKRRDLPKGEQFGHLVIYPQGEREYCEKFGIKSDSMPNPNRTFEELIGFGEDVNYERLEMNLMLGSGMFGADAIMTGWSGLRER